MSTESDDHMVSEGEARRLLARAASTIDVAPEAPVRLTGFPPPPGRRWPLVLAAAAAVVALVGGGLVLTTALGRDGDSSAADGVSASDPTPDPSVVVPSGTAITPPSPTPPTPPRRAAAEQFVRWARGTDPAPPFADRVRNMTPGFVSPWNDQPERREYWSGCSGLGFPDCGIDPVAMVHRNRGEVDVAACGPSCAAEGLATPDDAVVLSQQRGDMGAWGVVLWINAAGEIYAVGLGAPPTP